MSVVSVTHRQKSDQFLEALAGRPRFVIVMHDNPDPDAIATGWALQCLIQEKLQAPVRLIGGGEIVRAENRHMVDLLGPPIQLVRSIDERDPSAVILVDCGSSSSNQLLTSTGMEPVAIIDHHTDSCNGEIIPFLDLRPNVTATATIAASYLREQKVEPGVKLATALLYAVRTEARGSETSYSLLDQEIIVWLTERAEPEMLAEIENAPLALGWYSDLVLAMQCTTLFGDSAICFLPKAEGPEIVGEVADLLIRGRDIRRVLCAAIVGDDLLISVRTTKDAEDACRLVVETIGKMGSGGGHGRRAGGKIPGVVRDNKISTSLEEKIRLRWLGACQATDQSPRQLISRREIVENL